MHEMWLRTSLVSDGARKQVLLVERDSELLRQMATQLSANADEFSIITAGSGEEAIDILREQEVHLLCTDLHVAGATGFQLLAYVLKNCRTVPVIVLIGQESAQLKERIKGVSSIASVPKPVDYPRLAAMIRARLK